MPDQSPAVASGTDITTKEIELLGAASIEAKSRAYCPYSNFHVGATLLTIRGEHISGANVESVSYPNGTCAERVALCNAVTTSRCKAGDFKALAVATDNATPCSPCGMCRQALREFCMPNMPIYMFTKDGKHVMKTMGELLPMSFGPDDLPPPKKFPNY